MKQKTEFLFGKTENQRLMYLFEKNMQKCLVLSKESATFAMPNDTISINKVHTARLNKALSLFHFQLADCVVWQNKGDNAFFIVPIHNQIFNRTMPNDVKNLPQEQSAPVADVQPTKQATSIDPEKETTVIRPSKRALSNEKTYVWSRLWERNLRRAKFTEEPQVYLVVIGGTHQGNYGREKRRVEEIYYAYHPYMALGNALVNFMGSGAYGIATIEEYAIFHQTIKK